MGAELGGFSTGCEGCVPFESDDRLLEIRVVQAPIGKSEGARLTGYEPGEVVTIWSMKTLEGFEPLSWRYRDVHRTCWPSSYRFQAIRRSWHVIVGTKRGWGSLEQPCVLQVASNAEDRTLTNVMADVQDASVAASYATRFNRMLRGGLAEPGGAATEKRSPRGANDSDPHIKVAAPVAGVVTASTMPAIIPVGSHCTLSAYDRRDVDKFVFDGSEDFLELTQAFFHYAAFLSNGKEFVTDIQGDDDQEGHVLIIDPVILREVQLGATEFVGTVLGAPGSKGGPTQAAGAEDGPTAKRFERLHPQCGQVCRAFDPQRRSAKHRVGVCGMDVTCGLTGPALPAMRPAK
eukprot:NODE_10673_length_1336_cov_4.959471.p1 GENE.NODE_10673_length_1336_cov_4.959471~~NODE_10673_length_1336_cov_4.959471.p1  ORF type:complete len:347 (+),score=86.69 NODE_10673_length_1336_cov_4.959471:187-1227(+)